MGELSTYSLTDFIPFTSEVYLRLFERLNESVWPGHLLAVALGAAALVLAWRGRGRFWAMILAAAWASVGYLYHLRFYVELNWAATYFGWAFIAEAGLLAGMGLSGVFDRAGDEPTPGARIGLGVGLFAVALFPLIALVSGRDWSGAEVFGVAPDPTVVATLGLSLTAPRTRLLLLPIPLLWCLVTGATAWAVGTTSGVVTAAVGAGALGVAVWKKFAGSRA